MKKWQTLFTLIGGFILPVAAFALGLLFMLEDSFLNVMPTVIHAALVIAVPVINLAIWICLRRGRGTGSAGRHGHHGPRPEEAPP